MTARKKALITGASEGIGREFALQLSQSGYEITAVARNESRLKTLIAELGPGPHRYQVADLSESNGIEAVSDVLARSHFDLLINNAGYGLYGDFHEVPLHKIQNMIRLNCEALVALSHAFLINAQAGDALVNVASVVGIVPLPALGTYSATKAFVVSFSESLWFEQKRRGIYVTALCPGATATHFQARASGDPTHQPPEVVTQTPDQVVAATLKALRKRSRPVVVSGFLNRLFSSISSLIPRKLLLLMMGNAR